MKKVPSILQCERNEDVLSYLQPLSCHSDIIQPLYECLKDNDDVNLFCPDPEHYKYCIWYTNDTVFAFGAGMSEIGLRLPKPISTDASPSKVGKGWFLLPYNSDNIKKLSRAAYEHAKNL